MKKLFVMLLPTLALFLTSCPEGGNSCKKYMGLKGAVSKITDTTRSVDEEISGETAGVVEHTFDNKGNLVSSISGDERNRETHRKIYEYRNGVCIRTASMSPMADVIRIDSLKERKGNREVWEERNNGPLYRTVFVRTGDEVTKTKYSDNNVMFIERQKLDKQGNVLSSEIERNGKPEMQTLTSYDANGNETSITVLRDGKKIVTTYLYSEYDAKGNWTRRITSVDGLETVVTTRKIEYTK